jgi:hypothetical protein
MCISRSFLNNAYFSAVLAPTLGTQQGIGPKVLKFTIYGASFKDESELRLVGCKINMFKYMRQGLQET